MAAVNVASVQWRNLEPEGLGHEEWRPIVGWEGDYEVSSLGRVRSCERVRYVLNRWGSVTKRVIRSKMRKLQLDKDGYQTVGLYGLGESRLYAVHRLVLEAFVGSRPDGMEASHYPDNDPANCRVENLRWETPSANNQHKGEHGTKHIGETVNGSRLKNSDIAAIFEMRRQGRSTREIGARFGVRGNYVYRILKGEIWSHLGHTL